MMSDDDLSKLTLTFDEDEEKEIVMCVEYGMLTENKNKKPIYMMGQRGRIGELIPRLIGAGDMAKIFARLKAEALRQDATRKWR